MYAVFSPLVALGFSPGASRAQEPIAVVVNASNPISSMTVEGLRRLYLGQSAALPNREPVILLETALLRERFYGQALGMRVDQFKRHWISVLFAGEAFVPPRDPGSVDDLMQFVASHPGAIAFVALNRVASSVKVIAIEGARPGAPNYPLR